MKKNFMKFVRTAALTLGVFAFVMSSCSDYDDDITNMQSQIDGKASLAEVTKAVGDLKTELEGKITAAATEAATALAKAQEALTGLDGKLTAADLEGIKGDITDITTELDALPEGLGDIDFDELGALVGKLDDLQAQVDGLVLGLDEAAVIVLINTQLAETKATLMTLNTTVVASVTPAASGIVGTQNASIAYSVNDQAFLGDYTVSVVYALNDADKNTLLPPTITVEFGVTIEETAPTLDYNASIMTGNTGDNWGKYVGGSVAHYKAQQSIKELFAGHLEANPPYAQPDNFNALDFDVTAADSKFDVFNKDVNTLIATTASTIGDDYLLEEIGLKSGERLDVATLLVELQAFYRLANGQVLEGQKFTVNFMNPFKPS